MSRYLFFIAALFLTTEIIAQQITNIQVTQEGDNVVITYDLTASHAGQTFDVEVNCSADNGKTFSITPQSLTGDLKGITAGTIKRIVWDVLSERQELAGAQFVFQLVATPNKPKDSFEGNSGTFVDARDGHVYKWVKIGTQIWMAENLAYNSGNGCWAYNNDESNVSIYGRLYDWDTAKKSCPIGWHLPDIEWMMIIDFLGGNNIAGGKMKSVNGWNSPNKGANNSSGFTALPSGYGYGIGNGKFSSYGKSGSWWSSTELNRTDAYYSSLDSNYSDLFYSYCSKMARNSVRCVKD